MTSELAIRVSLILIRLILLLQISDIVDFIFIKHELVVLACLQFWPIKKVQYFTTITKER